MTIYLIRHGQTDWNNMGVIQGRTDNPLNDKGFEQAHQLSKKLKNIKPDLVISSSLKRAHQTMQTVYDDLKLNCQTIIDDDFIERDFGYFEGKHADEYYNATDYSIYENFEQTSAMQSRAINGIKKYNHGIIFIFSHSHLLKAVVTHLDGSYQFNELHLPNCAIVKVDDNLNIESIT